MKTTALGYRIKTAYRMKKDMATNTNERPNLLWIMADQLRYHALGSSGDPNIATPHIDRLVTGGGP